MNLLKIRLRPSDVQGFNTVTIKAKEGHVFSDGDTIVFTGNIRLSFAGLKNFKLNGKAMKSEVEAEQIRLARLTEEFNVPVTLDSSEQINTSEPEKIPVAGAVKYDVNEIYLKGDKVYYQGENYVCKWWSQGDLPNQGEPWERIPEIDQDGIAFYVPLKAYVGDEIVRYKGKKYKAKWWTMSVPDSDDTWSLVQ